MMPDVDGYMNKACVQGTITKPAFGEAGVPGRDIWVVRIEVETVQRFTRDGEERRASEFHKVAVFDPALRQVAKDARMGERVYLEGNIQTRKITFGSPAQQGYRTEIVLNPGSSKMMRLGMPEPEEGTDNEQ